MKPPRPPRTRGTAHGTLRNVSCSRPTPPGPRDSTLPVELLLERQRVCWLLELRYGFPLLGEHLQALKEEDRSASEPSCAPTYMLVHWG